MTSSKGGRIRPVVLRRGTRHMVQDTHDRVTVYRERGTSPVATFQTRIAQATSGVSGVLRERVQGDAGKVYYYLSAPVRADIQQGDIVWRGLDRFRVIATEAMSHEIQVLLQRIQ